MKRRVLVCYAIAMLMGGASALIARALLVSAPPTRAEVEATREWLEHDRVMTTLDLGGYRLSAPGGQVGIRKQHGAARLFAYRGLELTGITDATQLASYVAQVRGKEDGDEFWRLVRAFSLDVPAPEPQALSATPLPGIRMTPPPLAVGGGSFWWYGYDLGIGGGRSSPYLAAGGRQLGEVGYPHFVIEFGTRRMLAPGTAPEFLRGGAGIAIHKVLTCDEVGLTCAYEGTLEAGRLTLNRPAK
ncbi:MAG: hypothetical protein FD180_2270 [Planctomycetota bacterium]|nr:MAG: hypothetical protein FD180_2270 [Planctomycetota bacterium]